MTPNYSNHKEETEGTRKAWPLVVECWATKGLLTVKWENNNMVGL